MAEQDLWASQTLGDIGSLKPFFEAAQKGLELHKENAALIKNVYEVNKALLLSSIDPLFAAIDAILDEIIKLLDDLRGLGFYYLPVHSSSMDTSATIKRNPLTGALEIGETRYVKASWGSTTRTTPTGTEITVPELVPMNVLKGDAPARDVDTGEQLYIKAPAVKETSDENVDLTDRSEIIAAKVRDSLLLTSLTPGGILQTIDRQFDDVGDVPSANNAAVANSLLLDEDYYISGRPVFSDSATVGGIIIIAGAPSLDQFTGIMESFNKLISLESFDQLLKDLNKIFSENKPKQTIIVKEVSNKNVVAVQSPSNAAGPSATAYVENDDTQGNFAAMKDGDGKAICNQKGVVARITKVVSTEKMEKTEKTTPAHKSDTFNKHLTESEIVRRNTPIIKDVNLVPYQVQRLEIEYLTASVFEEGDIIAEAERVTTTTGFTDNEGKEVKDPTDKAGDATGGEWVQKSKGTFVVGEVANKYFTGKESEKPDWRGKRLEDLIPPLGGILDTAEEHIRGIKSTVKSSKQSIDPIIKYLDSKVDELSAFAAQIESILELFAVGIPATGIYSLYLEPKEGGTAEFRNRMLAAGGPNKPPEALKFCAGVCFLGGGPSGGPLVKSVETLALLLGLRTQTEEETKQQEDFSKLATPVYDNEKLYMADDEVYFRGSNYRCLKDNTTGEPPLIKDTDGNDIINALFWERLGLATGEEEEEIVGDQRTPEEIRKAKIEFLKDTKATLGEFLKKLNGIEGGAQGIRQKILAVPLFGRRDPTQNNQFLSNGATEGIFEELLGLRDRDLNELDLLTERINELLFEVEIALIQETPDLDVENGSLRSKGTSLMIINGKFVADVTDFNAGERKLSENTTVTIFDPLNPASGSSRTVVRMANNTVAILDEAFEPDIEQALSFDIILSDDVDTDYKVKDEYRANSTHYYHPGYRLRNFESQANTISTYLVTSGTDYIELPRHDQGTPFGRGAEGKLRTTEQYPLGTIIELNSFTPTTEGFEGGGLVQVEAEELDKKTWGSLGVSQDDMLLITIENEIYSRFIIEIIDDTRLAIDSAFQIGGPDSTFVDLRFHEDWDFDLSIGKKKEKADEDKIQASRNKFDDILKEINEKADEVSDMLSTFSSQTF